MKCVVQKVPVQVYRTEQEVQVRKIPYTVQRPVTENITYKVPVQTCRWERQEMVRKVPVTTQRIEYEDRVESTPVQVCRMATEVRKVMVPRTAAKWVPYVTTQYVPRTVVMQVPLDVPEVMYEPSTTYYPPGHDRAARSGRSVGHGGQAAGRADTGPAGGRPAARTAIPRAHRRSRSPK